MLTDFFSVEPIRLSSSSIACHTWELFRLERLDILVYKLDVYSKRSQTYSTFQNYLQQGENVTLLKLIDKDLVLMPRNIYDKINFNFNNCDFPIMISLERSQMMKDINTLSFANNECTNLLRSFFNFPEEKRQIHLGLFDKDIHVIIKFAGIKWWYDIFSCYFTQIFILVTQR